MIPLTRPLLAFDTESTGVTDQDRILQLAAIAIMPDGARVSRSWSFDPEMAIPAEATAVHGITDLDVAGCPTFRSCIGEILAFLLPCDFAGYNLKFDLRMINAELARAGQSAIPMDHVVGGQGARRVVDAMRVFQRKEPRDLKAAVRFYLGAEAAEEFQPHDALRDVEATIAVLEAQLARYEDLPRDLTELAAYCLDRQKTWVDEAGKIVWREQEAVLGFGKNAGRSLRDLAASDRGLLQWVLDKDFASDTKAIVEQALRGDFPVREPDPLP